jgi:hypothetical protein
MITLTCAKKYAPRLPALTDTMLRESVLLLVFPHHSLMTSHGCALTFVHLHLLIRDTLVTLTCFQQENASSSAKQPIFTEILLPVELARQLAPTTQHTKLIKTQQQ